MKTAADICLDWRLSADENGGSFSARKVVESLQLLAIVASTAGLPVHSSRAGPFKVHSLIVRKHPQRLKRMLSNWAKRVYMQDHKCPTRFTVNSIGWRDLRLIPCSRLPSIVGEEIVFGAA